MSEAVSLTGANGVLNAAHKISDQIGCRLNVILGEHLKFDTVLVEAIAMYAVVAQAHCLEQARLFLDQFEHPKSEDNAVSTLARLW